MRPFAVGILLVFWAILAGAATPTPTEVVQQRMAALNSHDFDAFRATYAPDVLFAVYPDRVLGEGHTHLEFIFAAPFADKSIPGRGQPTDGSRQFRYCRIHYDVRDRQRAGHRDLRGA